MCNAAPVLFSAVILVLQRLIRPCLYKGGGVHFLGNEGCICAASQSTFIDDQTMHLHLCGSFVIPYNPLDRTQKQGLEKTTQLHTTRMQSSADRLICSQTGVVPENYVLL